MKAYKVTITTIIVTDGTEKPDCWDIDRLMSEISEDTLADVGCVEMVEAPARRYQGDPAADGAAGVRQDMRDAAAADARLLDNDCTVCDGMGSLETDSGGWQNCTACGPAAGRGVGMEAPNDD